MSNFVDDSTTVPDGKLDAKPSPGPVAYYITADEWNAVMQAIYDLRNAVYFGAKGEKVFPASLECGGLKTTALATPTNGTFFRAGSGTLVAGTYWYRVTATNKLGQTLASSETGFVLTVTAGVTVNWTAVPGATGYKVYGRTTGAELLMATIADPAVLTWDDTGSVTPSGGLPTLNTTANASINGNVSASGTLGSTGDVLCGGGAIVRLHADTGNIETQTGKLVIPYSSIAGTPGNGTVNNASGRAKIAAGADKVVITCSKLSTTSVVAAWLEGSDTTLTKAWTTNNGDGTFTVHGNATAAADLQVGFFVAG